MPVRPATRRDIPIMAQVMAASFAPDPLFQAFFPHLQQYYSDYEGAIQEKLWLSWYNYRTVLMVSYSVSESKTDGNGDKDDEKAVTEQTSLLPQSPGRQSGSTTLQQPSERITGIAEWEREGRGWEWIHGAWGSWDPRLLMKPLLAFYYNLKRRLVRNRAAPAPVSALESAPFFWFRKNNDTTTTNPPPLTLWNFNAQIGPFMTSLFSEPHRQTRWLLHTLAVHPNEQGRGYGKELVADGLDRFARKDAVGELPAGVCAADGKEAFYQKMGFKVLVGWASRTESADGTENPMKRNGVGGGAVLWTW